MSTGRGRSWRPEKARRTRDSRKVQVRIVASVLVLLVATVVYLVTRPAVPALNVVRVIDRAGEVDSGWLPSMPNAAAEFTAERIAEVITRIHELNPQLVNAPGPLLSLSDLTGTLPIPEGQKLVLYLNCAARVVPDPDAGDSVIIELFSGRGTAPAIRLSTVLDSIQKSNPTQSVLMLDLQGAEAGFASGSLAADINSILAKTIEAAAIPGMTVLCATSENQRSWGFVETAVEPAKDKPTSPASSEAAEPSGGNPKPAAAARVAVRGTVFGHFVADAFLTGQVATVQTLITHLQRQVSATVMTQYGENQNVAVYSANPERTAAAELLPRLSVPSASDLKQLIAPSKTEDKDKPGAESTDAKSVPKSDPEKTEAPSPVDPADDAETILANLIRRRQQLLADGIAPVAMPANWIDVRNNLFAAGVFATHGFQSRFGETHDRLTPQLDVLEKRAARFRSVADDGPIVQWICLPVALSADDRKQFQSVLESIGIPLNPSDPADRAVLLPPELQSAGPRQRAFVTWLTEEFHSLSTQLSTLGDEGHRTRVMPIVLFLENLTAAKWKQEDRPHQLALLADLLTKENADWHTELIPILDQLLRLRQQCLQLAAGSSDDGRLLRRDVYIAARSDLQAALAALTAAERWLAVGKTGLALSRDSIQQALAILTPLGERVRQQQLLAAIAERQLVEVPLLMETLAALQEQVKLAGPELESAARMAAAVVDGQEVSSLFPQGLRTADGFEDQHVTAMFALTRNLNCPECRPAEAADEQHYRLLKDYVAARDATRISATESIQRLKMLEFDHQSELLRTLYSGHPASSGSRSSGSGAAAETKQTGLWLSFWSIRMLEALGSDRTVLQPLWTQWKGLTAALRSDDPAAPAIARARLAAGLQSEWRARFQHLKNRTNESLFTEIELIRQVIGHDLMYHFEGTMSGPPGSSASRSNGLYAGIHKRITNETAAAANSLLEIPQRQIELGADNRSQLRVNVRGAAAIYVLDDGVYVDGTGSSAVPASRWHQLPVTDDGTASGGERVIPLAARASLKQPLDLLVAAVNSRGIVTSLHPFTVYPNSESDWEIDVVRPDGKSLTLINIETTNTKKTRRLTLLPTTKDTESGDDAGLPLTVQLRRVKGTAARIRLQLVNVTTGAAVWREPRLVEINPETRTVVIDLKDAGAPAPAAPPAPAAAPDAGAAVVDFSDGFRFEIRPDDVLRSEVSVIEIRPDIVDTGAERFVRPPQPTFDTVAYKLRLRLDHAVVDQTTLRPNKVPVEFHFSRRMAEYLQPGGLTKVPGLPPTGQDFEFSFDSAIEQQLTTDGLEFGLSVAGIPHAWQWQLRNGKVEQVGLANPEVRVELELKNDDVVKPVRRNPALLLGENWANAVLHADVHLHGMQIDPDHQWILDLKLRDAVSLQPVSLIPNRTIKSRQLRKVLVSSGEEMKWVFRTATTLYSPEDWNPRKFDLPDGRYELVAEIHPKDSTTPTKLATAPFILDGTKPTGLTVRKLERRNLVTNDLQGEIIVSDRESGIASITARIDGGPKKEIGFNRAAAELDPSTPVTATLTLKTDSFPRVPQLEEENTSPAMLIVEVKNHAGLTELTEFPLTFVMPGKPKVVMKEEKPGGIVVTFKTSTPYKVSIKGPSSDTKVGSGSVAFPNLKPGKYTVSWQTDGLGLKADSRTVTVESGKDFPLDTSTK